MEKRFLTGNRASRLLPFEWPASVVILESNALQTVRYNAKIWKKEKKILAARLNASDALLLSKAPLKFKECSDGGYWLHKNAHTPCKKSSHLALPSQFESGMARKMRSFYGSLIFMIWCAYSISMPSFWREIQIVMRSFYVSWESSRQLNNQRLLPSQETKLETVALLTFKSDYQLDFRTTRHTFAHTKRRFANRLKTWSLQFYLSKENQFHHQDSNGWKHSGKTCTAYYKMYFAIWRIQRLSS